MYAINKLQSNRSIYQVDVLSVNFRLESVIGGNPRDVRVVARSEALLLKTYGADIPNPVGDEVNGEVDSVSVDILKKFQPVVLEDVYPARVAADGNCLYRAISKVICGNEALFIPLRIFTLLEILSYPMFYDCDHKRFVDLISDNRIVVSTYSVGQRCWQDGCICRYDAYVCIECSVKGANSLILPTTTGSRICFTATF